MQKGGLNAAVTDLENRLNKAGIKGNEVGAVMTTLFGKKAGSGLDVLMGQYDRLESKYPELEKSAKGFNSAVDQQNATITQRVNQLEASLEAIGIKIGNAILPYVTQFLGEVSKGLSWLEQHGSVFKMLAVGLGALTAAMIVAKIATIEWTATLLANPVVLITMAIVGLAMGVYYAYNHFAKFREIVNDVGRFLKNVLGVAIDYIRAHLPEIESALKRVGSVLEGAWKVAWHAAEAVVRWFGSVVIPWFRGRLADLAAWWKSHGHEVEMVVKGLWVTLETIFKVGMNMIRLIYGPWVLLIIHLWKFLWDVLKGTLITAWDLIKNIVEMAWHSLLNIFGLFFDILTGKWGKAWQDAKKLVTQGFADITRVFSGFQHDAIRFLEQAGKDLIQGLINGVKSMVGNAVGAVKGIGSSIVSGFKSLLGIHSPSRVMYEHGMNVVQGLVNALHDGRSMAGSAAERLGQAIMGNIGLSSAATVRLGGLTVDAPSLGTVGGLPGGVVQNIVQLEVQGHVLTDQDLRDLIHQELLRLDGRNGGSYLTAKI
jgi:phage-related protein